ncbi:complement C1q-like protein 4 [Centropristis striata]|uniref:complement C1q-like protein 4 n=1 Tax=Centropristis striata TaxID=184440 RepID=UPI0027E19F91|nr:complement C1q-like protein 4 [Centropristis striata]
MRNTRPKFIKVVVAENRSAFSVSLSNDSSVDYFENTTVIYNHVFLNLGDNYNTSSGVFTAPRAGVYSFAVTIYSGRVNHSCAELQVNGIVVVKITERKANDAEDSATVVITQSLMAGDCVLVFVPTGCYISYDNNHRTTFTGFLLFSLDMDHKY